MACGRFIFFIYFFFKLLGLKRFEENLNILNIDFTIQNTNFKTKIKMFISVVLNFVSCFSHKQLGYSKYRTSVIFTAYCYVSCKAAKT